jgi:hypothetical protein
MAVMPDQRGTGVGLALVMRAQLPPGMRRHDDVVASTRSARYLEGVVVGWRGAWSSMCSPTHIDGERGRQHCSRHRWRRTSNGHWASRPPGATRNGFRGDASRPARPALCS